MYNESVVCFLFFIPENCYCIRQFFFRNAGFLIPQAINLSGWLSRANSIAVMLFAWEATDQELNKNTKRKFHDDITTWNDWPFLREKQLSSADYPYKGPLIRILHIHLLSGRSTVIEMVYRPSGVTSIHLTAKIELPSR